MNNPENAPDLELLNGENKPDESKNVTPIEKTGLVDSDKITGRKWPEGLDAEIVSKKIADFDPATAKEMGEEALQDVAWGLNSNQDLATAIIYARKKAGLNEKAENNQ